MKSPVLFPVIIPALFLIYISSFQTFQFGTANGLRPLNHSETIACDVQVCLTGDNNKCVPNTSDEQCPSEPEGYNYKLIGGAHN